MSKYPKKCTMCEEVEQWKLVDKTHKCFSVGKAVVGGFLFGPVGLIGGGFGKNKHCYYCGKCGFNYEY